VSFGQVCRLVCLYGTRFIQPLFLRSYLLPASNLLSIPHLIHQEFISPLRSIFISRPPLSNSALEPIPVVLPSLPSLIAQLFDGLLLLLLARGRLPLRLTLGGWGEFLSRSRLAGLIRGGLLVVLHSIYLRPLRVSLRGEVEDDFGRGRRGRVFGFEQVGIGE
jgi:hypothetical protein